jgi:hypothetical protein
MYKQVEVYVYICTAFATRNLKDGFNSGAPPVKSTVYLYINKCYYTKIYI